jgi:adenylate cyclase
VIVESGRGDRGLETKFGERPQDLWGLVTGRVGATVAAAGAGIQAGIGRFRELAGAESPDFAAHGMLKGAADREARETLLRELYAAGVPMTELRHAVERDRLSLLPVEGVLQGDGEYTLKELADETGIAEATLARRFNALGLVRPESDSPFNGDALAAAKALNELEEAGLPEASIEEICRISGSRVSNLARGLREVFREAYVDAETSEHELGLRYAAAARRMLPVFEPLLRFTLTMSMLNLVRSDMVSHAERVSGSVPGGKQVAVCFADLAGFTHLAETLTPEQVGDVVGRFETLVSEHAPPAARHVKTVGDGAMIVTDKAALALRAAQGLVKAADALGDDFPRIHAGVAAGTAITSGGDWYGAPVNLASRLAECAPPGEIYATDEVHELTGNTLEPVGTRRLNGIEEVVAVFSLSP